MSNPVRNIHYLETSAVNLLADELDDFEFIEFIQNTMKIDFCISAVVLWEILLNSSKDRKERLLYWAQFNCADYLLKTPTELVLSYIQAGLPIKDKKEFWYNRESTLDLAKTWKNIHRKVDRTLLVDVPSLVERTSPMRSFSKMHKRLLHAMTDKEEEGYEEEYFHRMMIKLLNELGRSNELERSKEKQFKISLILAFFVVCIGVELDNSPVRKFWSPIGIGIDDPCGRLEYLITNYSKLFIRGPIAEMALMIVTQSDYMNSANRGMLHDSLHTMYCYYADNVISNDEHFLVLKDRKLSWFFEGIIPAQSYIEIMNISRDKLIDMSKTEK